MRPMVPRSPFLSGLLILLLLTPLLVLTAQPARAQEGGQVVVGTPGVADDVQSIQPDATAVVNMAQLAMQAALHAPTKQVVRPWVHLEGEEPAEPYFPPALELPEGTNPFQRLMLIASPLPTFSYMGLNDIAMVDSSYIVIPPDVAGAVGPSHVMCSFNNNYRIQDKATGATIITVGTATFWAPVVALSERLSLTDPRTVYDPYNNCWIAAMQTVTTNAGKMLVAVSATSDPTGMWYLYSFNAGYTLDFPNLGFNKNWISFAINRYSSTGTFQRGINLVVNYPLARTGTGSGTLFTHTSSTHYCSAPCVTYSASQETLYVVTHLSSTGATYQLDTITGTAAAPVYTSGGTLTRTGGGWAQPSGNQLPQAAPLSGTSACGATPCKIESQDSQVRSAPMWRGSRIWYTQTIGLPSTGLTHEAAQWTKIATPGGAYVAGGRVEDATATATNGGKWYAYCHIAVNNAGDFLLGYTQFSSAQYPSAGYSMHVETDGAGTLRDPVIYHAGEDYYHKTFSTATGRNRWGDFSTVQVDPADGATIWALQEYAKARATTDDGNTGSNASKWSSWWAGVQPPDTQAPSVTVTYPNGGEILYVDVAAALTWTANDNVGVTCVDLLLSRISPAGPYETIATCVPNTGTYNWTVTGPETNYATLKVVAHDAASNTGEDVSDAEFSIVQAVSVLLPEFRANPVEAGVSLHWQLAGEIASARTEVERSESAAGPYARLDAAVSPDGQGYMLLDNTAQTGQTYWYRLSVQTSAGQTITFEPLSAKAGIPIVEFALSAAAPNPTHGNSSVSFAVPRTSHVRIRVLDVMGHRVATLADREFSAGRYQAAWNGQGERGPVASGVYFIRMEVPNKNITQRVVLMR